MLQALKWAALAFFALATIGLVIAFPLTYVFTCGPNKREFYGDAPAQLKKLVRADEDIIKPNGCNVCPAADQFPVWIAPGDMCDLPGYDSNVFEHCDPKDEHDHENDFDPDHHFKACLAKEQIDHLWSTGHCHDEDTTQPFVASDGLLFCCSSLMGCSGFLGCRKEGEKCKDIFSPSGLGSQGCCFPNACNFYNMKCQYRPDFSVAFPP